MKKGQVTLYLYFLVVAIVIIVIAGFVAPLGAKINTEFYLIGQDIIEDNNSTIQQISDPVVRAQLTNISNLALAATADNIEIQTQMFQYSWLLVLGITALVMFLFSRRLVEYGGGGGFV